MRSKLGAIFILSVMMYSAFPAHGQTPDCSPLRELLKIPEIKSDPGSHILKATVLLNNDQRAVPGISRSNTITCDFAQLRLFQGYATGQPQPWPKTDDILPGPTLRARVGDLVELTFLNQVNPKDFPNTLDQGEIGKTPGCDVATFVTGPANGKKSVQGYPRATLESGPPWNAPPWTKKGETPVPGDTYPNCLHGSSTANLHYHGTHTTPSTTGDNVLLFIHPSLRDTKTGKLEPEESFVNQQFAEYFQWCEKNGPAQKWAQMPPRWQEKQKQLLMDYDKNAPYQGVNGNLPADMKLWPRNEHNLSRGLWPQYSIGAFPYCFKLPEYHEIARPDKKPAIMGQSPGTHWYHAHKHGSTALNVGNGMTGALIIEGAYDEALRSFYKETSEHKNWGLEEQVLVIQQPEAALNLLSPTTNLPNGVPPLLQVNGRRNPIVKMKPNQVQMWRIVDGAARNFVRFDHFEAHGPGLLASIAWRQIAQDGVQFAFENYERVGKVNAKFTLATANRADLLVKAPGREADYALQVEVTVSDVPSATPFIVTLLTVQVRNDDKPIDPPMDFIKEEKDFPAFPSFLADVPGNVYHRPELAFNTDPSAARSGKGYLPRHSINGKLFEDQRVDQCMTLDTAEEWKLVNKTTNIAHPFHIHINPFQIVELFQPNLPEAKDPNNKCYVNPDDPESWKPCHPLQSPWVWWDTFNIPTGQQIDVTSKCTQSGQVKKEFCPAKLQDHIECTDTACTEFIPGYFKMRSRFVDFTGEYVLHCHVLAHEDRGMMELVAVEEKGACKPNMKSEYSHH